jgi:hypothetical protein
VTGADAHWCFVVKRWRRPVRDEGRIATLSQAAHTTSLANNREMHAVDEEQVVTDPHEERDKHLICLLRAILHRADSAGRSGVQLLASSL